MLRTVALVFLGLCGAAHGQVLTLADVKAKNAVQLSADDLRQLMPTARVVSHTHTGSTRRWENAADGTVVASSDRKGKKAGRTRVISGNGTWRIADNGTYCVTIEWSVTSTEEWCRYIFKDGDKYFGFGNLEDSAPASAFDFSK
jgi:hypothetical protein